jgi:hypothetical protein
MPLPALDFTGIAPRLNAEASTQAQAAEDARIDGGVLAPLAIQGPVQSLHETEGANAGEMKIRVPAGELPVPRPDKPGAPTVASCVKICQPFNGTTPRWLMLTASAQIQTMLTAGGAITSTDLYTPALTVNAVRYTPRGFKVFATLGDVAYGEVAGRVYNKIGPRFSVACSADDGGAYGGPAETVTFPETPYFAFGQSTYPDFALPLFDDHGHNYGNLRLLAVECPVWDEVKAAAATWGALMEGGEVVFTFSCGYQPDVFREFVFCQSIKDAGGREGVPSELLEGVSVGPGERLTLTLPGSVPAGGARRLYRSGGEYGRELRLLAEIEAADDTGSWSEGGEIQQEEPVPFYGDFTQFGYANSEEGKAEFLRGAVEHPDRFLAAPVQKAFGGDKIRVGLAFSDYGRYHAWPKEWFVPLAESYAEGSDGAPTLHPLALAGGTILAFLTREDDGEVTGEVYAASGTPERMQSRRISSTTPLLNELGLTEASGGRVCWPTHDGLAVTGGGAVEIATAGQFSRAEWQALEPEHMRARAAGALILLEPDGAGESTTNLLVDLDAPPERRCLTFTATSGAYPRWKSPRVRLEKPIYLDYVRLDGSTGSAAVELAVTTYNDAGAATTTTKTILAAELGKPYPLGGLGPCRAWEYQLKILSADPAHWVRPPEFYERKILEVGPEGITLNASNVELWENVWLKFPDQGRFVQLFFSGEGGGSARFSFMNRAGTELFSVTGSPGAVAALTAAGNTDQELWRLKVTEAGGGALSQPLESVTLLARRVEETGGGPVSLGKGGVLPPAASAFLIPGGGELACAQIVAAAYDTPPELSLLGDGEAVSGSPVSFLGRDFRALPLSLGRHVVWDWSIASAAKVLSATIIPRQTVSVPAGDLHLAAEEPGLRRWMREEYDFGREVELASVYFEGEDGRTIRLYADGNRVEASPNWTNVAPLASGVEAEAPLKCRRLLIMTDDDFAITSIRVFLNRVDDIGPEGWTLTRPLRRKGYLVRFPAGVGTLAGARLSMADYPEGATLTLRRDAAEAVAVPVTDGKYVTLPRTLGEGHLWRVDLPETGVIERVELIPRRTEPWSAGTLELTAREGLPWPWLGAVFEAAPEGAVPKSFEVRLKGGKSYAGLSLQLFKDRAANATITKPVANSGGASLGNAAAWGSMELDFGARNAEVEKVLIHPRRVIECGNAGVVIPGRGGLLEVELHGKGPVVFGAAQVLAGSYEGMQLSLVPLGEEESFQEVTGDAPFHLAGEAAPSVRWLFSLSGGANVDQVRLFGRVHDLDKRGRVEILQEDDRASLLGICVQGPTPFMLACGRVRATGAVTVRFYENGAVTAVTAQPNKQFFPPRRRAALRMIDVEVPKDVIFHSLALSTSPETL